MSHRWTRFSIRSALLLVALTCLLLGLRANRIQRQKEAATNLQELGAQFQLTDTGSNANWLLGATPDVRELHFLGPGIGDETVEEIALAASKLRGLERMVLVETRVSREGERRLRARLAEVEVERFSPVLAPPGFPIRR